MSCGGHRRALSVENAGVPSVTGTEEPRQSARQHSASLLTGMDVAEFLRSAPALVPFSADAAQKARERLQEVREDGLGASLEIEERKKRSLCGRGQLCRRNGKTKENIGTEINRK